MARVRWLGTGFVAKRPRRVLHNEIHGIKKPSWRRLARRGGVKRFGGQIYEEIKKTLLQFLLPVTEKCALITRGQIRKVITTPVMIMALQMLRRPVYGF